MYRFKPGLPSLLPLAIASLLLASACSGGEGDSNELVNIHVFNGYPGSTSLTVYGPTGPIVSNLPFGERTDAPVLVNRNLGNDFTIILEGTPDPFQLAPELFDLYPHETVTMVIGNRSGVNSIDVNVVRHIQSISPYCRIAFSNALSVNNSGLANFNYFPAWLLEGTDLPISGYNQTQETTGLDLLESLLPPSIDISPYRRNNLYNAINAYPYFALVTADEEESSETTALEFVWVGPEDFVEMPRVDFQSGRLATLRNTRRFLECMFERAENALEDSGGGGDIDDPEFDQCLEEEEYSVQVVSPGATEQVLYHYHPGFITGDLSSNRCDSQLRLFSDFGNIFTGEHGYDGWSGSNRIDIDASGFNQSEHYFFVLYGYPVNPRVTQWTASDPSYGFGPLGSYP